MDGQPPQHQFSVAAEVLGGLPNVTSHVGSSTVNERTVGRLVHYDQTIGSVCERDSCVSLSSLHTDAYLPLPGLIILLRGLEF